MKFQMIIGWIFSEIDIGELETLKTSIWTVSFWKKLGKKNFRSLALVEKG